MGIAGTPFELGDVDEVMQRLGVRAARCRSSDESIEYAVRRCKSGHALCLVCPDGTVVLTLNQHEDGTMTAFVLLAVSKGATNAFALYEEPMLAIARDLKADYLAFKTYRTGWDRILSADWRRCGSDSFSRRT